MKGLDDGPDGLNDAAFDRALSSRKRSRKAPLPPVGSYIHGHHSCYRVVAHLSKQGTTAFTHVGVISPMGIRLNIEWDTELTPASSWRVEVVS